MSIGTLGDGEDRRTQIIARLAEIRREMGERGAELEALQRELEAHPGEESPEQQRRRFFLIPGGLAGIAAFLGAAPAWARRHGKSAATGLAGAAVGSLVTAAAIGGHGGAAPHAAPQPSSLPPVPVPTATLAPAPSPSRGAPRPRRTSVPPTVAIPTRARRPGPSPQPTPTPAGPSPSPYTPPPSPPPSTTRPSPSPSCVVLLEVGRIITVCL